MSLTEGPSVGHLLRLCLLLACMAVGGFACASTAVTPPKTRVVAGPQPVKQTPAVASSPGTPRVKASSVAPKQELASLLQAHKARRNPASGSQALGSVPAHTPITEERTVLPVLRERRGWLKVRLPGRPNSHVGWIRKAATRLWSTKWHISLDLSRRKVVVYRASKPVKKFLAVIGKPSTPTPTGSFFVEESLALPSTTPGAPYALALSARSNVFQEFDGGPGQVAIHGIANIGGVPGTAVSHGCIRLSSEAMRWLVYHVKPGVPVTITR
jgi:lipoprotein-anchoring transpeptidase ErfK/SrfK